jgi:hypothetical protein
MVAAKESRKGMEKDTRRERIGMDPAPPCRGRGTEARLPVAVSAIEDHQRERMRGRVWRI